TETRTTPSREEPVWESRRRMVPHCPVGARLSSVPVCGVPLAVGVLMTWRNFRDFGLSPLFVGICSSITTATASGGPLGGRLGAVPRIVPAGAVEVADRQRLYLGGEDVFLILALTDAGQTVAHGGGQRHLVTGKPRAVDEPVRHQALIALQLVGLHLPVGAG